MEHQNWPECWNVPLRGQTGTATRTELTTMAAVRLLCWCHLDIEFGTEVVIFWGEVVLGLIVVYWPWLAFSFGLLLMHFCNCNLICWGNEISWLLSSSVFSCLCFTPVRWSTIWQQAFAKTFGLRHRILLPQTSGHNSLDHVGFR